MKRTRPINESLAEPLLWLAFDEAARSHPDALAYIDGAISVSYEELHAGARHCATQLRDSLDRNASERGFLVALVARDPVATLAWTFGALSTGASVVAIAPSGRDRAAQLRLLRPEVIVTCAGGAADDPQRNPNAARRRAPDARPAGVIVCTAGTTGEPKAVVHSHATLGHAVRRLQLFRLESAGVPGRVPAGERELTDDLLEAAGAPALGLRYATTLPLTTMAGLTVALQALLAGETLVLPPTSDATALLRAIADAGVTNVSLTPLLAQLVLRALREHPVPGLDRLLFAGIGGGPVAPALAERLESALGCAVAVGYGTTEAGGAITMGRLSDPPDVRHHTAGRALPGVTLTVDAQTRELAVDCASTAVGYANAEGTLKLIERGAQPTGDLAVMRADGAVELCGRVDALILRGGRNIDPVRIERALEGHPAVRRAAAFGVSNRLVAGEQDIWTAVVLEHTVDETELRAHCSRSLGASLTPRRVIEVETLPLTADGAVRRHELARLVDARPRSRTRRS